MRIDCIDIYKLDVEIAHPVKVPLGTVNAARNVAVRITTDSGISGWGEASPFAPITGDDQETCYIVAQQFARALKGKNPAAITACNHALSRLTTAFPSMKSAFDMALHDIAARAAGVPLYVLLGGTLRDIRTDLTVGLQDSVDETVRRSLAVVAAGFNVIKLKVGRPGLEDVEHVAAVREAVGDDVALRIDSNQGWNYQTARSVLETLKPYRIDYSEQPIPAWDHANLARLRNTVDIPICADESVFTDRDAMKLLAARAVDYLNIKLGKAGGIDMGRRIAAVAAAADCACMIGCFSESRLALTAAAHLVMACPNIVFFDLDSAYEFLSDPVQGGITYDDGVGGLIRMPDGPGLGAGFDEGFLTQSTAVHI